MSSRALEVSAVAFKKKCPYKEKYDKSLMRLDHARAELQTVLDDRAAIHERTNVLCDMISTQECVMEQLGKHWSWLHSIPPDYFLQAVAELPSVSAAASGAENPTASEHPSVQHQDQYRQHTCVRMVDAATPQLLQQVISMTTQDWVCTCRCHFKELAVLLELVNRPPQVYREDPSAFTAAAAMAASLAAETDAAAAGQTAPDTAAAAAATTSKYQQLQQTAIWEPRSQQQAPAVSMTSKDTVSGATEAAAAAALSSDEYMLPWEQDPLRLLVEAVCRQGPKFQVALLHRSVPLFEAATLNLETLQNEMPSPHYWRRAVDRLHLSPSQVLHFKVAAQEYRRLTRAATAAGLDLIQVTKEFSLTDIAAKYAEAGEQPTEAATCTSTAGPDRHSAAAAGGSHTAPLQGAGQTPAGAPLQEAAKGAAQDGNGSLSSGLSSDGECPAGGGCSAQQQGAVTGLSTSRRDTAAAAAAAEGGQLSVGSPMQQLDAKLQRHLNSFFSNIYLVNTFCTNVLTPYQHAVMWCASYPYFPILGAMAEALETVPPTEPTPWPRHVQARIDANIEQHTACRSAVMAQQRRELCWWEP